MTALIFSALILIGSDARAGDSPNIEARAIERGLYEAFIAGHPPNPALLREAERSNSEPLLRLVNQVLTIQRGTDGSESGKEAQMAKIRSLGAAGGMPAPAVIKTYLEARSRPGGSGPAASAGVALIPEKNRARMEQALRGNLGASLSPGTGPTDSLARADSPPSGAPDATLPLKASDFRPVPKPLGIKAPPAVLPVEFKPEKSLYRLFMDDGFETFVSDQKLVNRVMAENKEQRADDCKRALSLACLGNNATVVHGYVRTFLNATGKKLTGAQTSKEQIQELGALSLDLSPVGGLKQIASDYKEKGLGHFADKTNFGFAVLGVLPFTSTIRQTGTSVRAVRNGESALAEAKGLGRTALDDALGAHQAAAVVTQVARTSKYSPADMRRMGAGFEAEDLAAGIRRLTQAELAQSRLTVRGGALHTPQGPLPPGNYLYAMDETGAIFVHPPGTNLRHSSLVPETIREATEFTVPGAKAGVEKVRMVRVAGHLCVGKKGKITGVNRASGHFKPAREDLAETVGALTEMGASVPSAAVHWDYIGTVLTSSCN